MKITNLVIDYEKSSGQFTFATVDIEETGWFKTKKETVEVFSAVNINRSDIVYAPWRLVSDGSIMPQDKMDALVWSLMAKRSLMDMQSRGE